jgi:hypothetical protein
MPCRWRGRRDVHDMSRRGKYMPYTTCLIGVGDTYTTCHVLNRSDWLPVPSYPGPPYALTLFEILFGCLHAEHAACLNGCNNIAF